MVKVLIYGSKELYDTASFVGRAESDIVAYRKDDGYFQVVKNRTGRHLGMYVTYVTLSFDIRYLENQEWEREEKEYQSAVFK